MEIVHARCCGLDVHKNSVVACVLISQPDGLIKQQMRTFKTMTADLLELADWLQSGGSCGPGERPGRTPGGRRYRTRARPEQPAAPVSESLTGRLLLQCLSNA